MARKKPEKSEMPATAEPEAKVKPVRLDLSEEDHRILRVMAAEAGKPMSVFARESLMGMLRAQYSKRAR